MKSKGPRLENATDLPLLLAHQRLDEMLAGSAQPGGAFRHAGMALLATLLMLWPAGLGGMPIVLDDTASYLRGGDVGFHTGLLMLTQWYGALFPAASGAADANVVGGAAVAQSAIAQSGGARSVVYSLASYLLRAPGNSLAGLVLVQAGCVAFLLVQAQASFAPRAGQAARLLAVAAVSVFTGAAWYASTAMPDIFAGIAILAIVLLVVHIDRLALPARIALVLLIALAITVHASHVPIALALLPLGALAYAWTAPGNPRRLLAVLPWLAAPMLLGMGALLASSLVGFGEASLVPKRYPLTLARSIEDGPGLWYLQGSCGSERYAICEIYGEDIPSDMDDFLWGPNGVRMRATPGQMERIRAEEMTIVRRAAAAYPLAQAGLVAKNFGSQLWFMGLSGLQLGNAVVEEPGGQTGVKRVGPDRPVVRKVAEVLNYLMFFGSVAFLAWNRRRLTHAELAAVGLVIAGLLINAAVCGILSAVVDRYQGRVAWVLPAVTLTIWLRLRAERDFGASRRPATP